MRLLAGLEFRRASAWRWIRTAAVALAVASCQDAASPVGADIVDTLSVSPESATITVGTTAQLVAHYVDSHGQDVPATGVFWSSEDVNIAAVDQHGIVTGVVPGSVQIAASVGGRSGLATVTVSRRPVAIVRVSPPDAVVAVGRSTQLDAEAEDSGGEVLTGLVVTWSSSNTAIATVDSTGEVSGVGAGVATIRAAVNGKQGSAAITVVPIPVARVVLAPTSATVAAGSSVQIDATTLDATGAELTGRLVSWSSSNQVVAIVSSSGRVQGLSPGSTTITATCEGVSGTATITVTPGSVTSVTLSPPGGSLNVGESLQFSAAARDAQGNLVTGIPASWKSSPGTVATVSSTGLVTALGVGTATVTATIGGVSGSATVTVGLVPIASITITPPNPSVEEKKSIPLTATARDANGQILTGRTIVWSSSDGTIVAVSQSGNATGLVPGSATITASSPGGGAGGSTPSGTTDVTVTYAPVASVRVTPATASIQEGAQQTFSAVLLDASGQTLSATGRTVAWSSLNPGVAIIDASTGVATGVKAGTATIRALASSPGQSSPASGTATLTVTDVPVASVTVSPASGIVHVGTAYARQFSAVTRDASGNILTGRQIVWTSSNQAVAIVDASTGVVTGRAIGSTTITATSEGVPGSAAVTVDLVPVATVSVIPPSVSLRVGDTQQLTATPQDSAGNAISGSALGGRSTSWATSDATVALVTTSGLVTATGTGSASVTATIDATTGASQVTVSPLASSLTLALAADSVIVPGTVSGTVTVLDAASQPVAGLLVSFTSSAPAVASVAPSSATSSASGTVGLSVAAQSPGTATISASGGGASDAALVRVLAAVQSVQIAPASSTIGLLQSEQLLLTALDASGAALAGRPCTMSSSNVTRATVSPTSGVTNGAGEIPLTVVGLLKGGVTISGTCGGITGTAAVNVK